MRNLTFTMHILSMLDMVEAFFFCLAFYLLLGYLLDRKANLFFREFLGILNDM